MKTKYFALATLAFALSLSGFASEATFTGVLTDDMCTKKHMMPGKTNAECVRECVQHGAKYVVVSGGKVIELKGNQEQFSELASKKVTVTGNLAGKALTVTTIKAAQ
ncbi:MAG TPA: hypothetical protein VN622_15740 [Clostridia bacterium]|nr:hypothetical protein [Clostridia bacterium]